MKNAKQTYEVFYISYGGRYCKYTVETTTEKKAVAAARKELNCERFGKIKVMKVEVAV